MRNLRPGSPAAATGGGEPGVAGAWDGTWSSSTTYKTKELVFFEGSSYISIKEPNLNQKPNKGNSEYWNLVAKEGAKGETGEKGATGSQGVTGATGAEGKEGIVWKGVWSSTTTYGVKEAVFFEGNSYISIKASNLNQKWASLVKLKLCNGAPGSVGKVESA